LENNINYSDLVKKAQAGCQQSLDTLAQQAHGGLFAYIYRLTLNYDVTTDIQQETLLAMVKYIKTLENPDRFWAWMYRVALGKVQQYYRDRKSDKLATALSAAEKDHLMQRAAQSHNDGLKNLINKELSQTIIDAIAKLKLRYRNVLILRCYEQLPYSEIAGIMDCTPFAAQLLFFRAKHSLQQSLAKK